MNLEVDGRHALLFDDDVTAAFVNSREALVPWNQDASLLIDRYDVRHLLDRIPPRPETSTWRRRHLDDGCDAIFLVELDGERYRDLPLPGDKERKDLIPETRERSEATDASAYQAVLFSYDEKNESSVCHNTEYHSCFRPPFEVPEFLLNHLPPTEKLHQIMARTAMFVSVHGGQSEIVLRVKQGNNPTFGFLMPDHRLHVYFRYLVDHSQFLKHYTDSPKKEETTNPCTFEAGAALSLLGSVYGTGDDDDFIHQTETKENETHNLADTSNEAIPVKSENGEVTTAVLGNKEAIKQQSYAVTAEKPLLLNKVFLGNVPTVASSRKSGDAGFLLAKEIEENSQKGTNDLKASILEPPAFMKSTIEKIVEFIVRNGKQFEAVLIEQDRNIGRFPFLFSTNQYHSYYLKIFEEAHESKIQGKDLFVQKHDAEHGGNRQKKVQSHGKDTKNVNVRDRPEFSDGACNYDYERKEKFKMILGGLKKDSQDEQSKVTKPSALSADEAAAIVLAVTKGVSPANATTLRTNKNCGATADEAAAIVMAATRGRSPANAPQHLRDNGQRISNSHGLSGLLVPALEPTAQSDKMSGDVTIATVIAKTAALAASREADSAESGLTKEQKLKTERLKRAKMFAALIKNGSRGSAGDNVHSVSHHSSASLESSAGFSMQNGTDSRTIEASGTEHESSVKRRLHSGSGKNHHDDSDDDYKHSRKKHHSSRKKDEQMYDRSTRSSRERESHHHHRRHSSSEDDQRRQRSSNHHRHYRIFDQSSEKYEELRPQKKHHSHSKRKLESGASEEAEFAKASDGLSASMASIVSDGRDVPASDEKPTADAAEIPNDLRAKIRAMLLETL